MIKLCMDELLKIIPRHLVLRLDPTGSSSSRLNGSLSTSSTNLANGITSVLPACDMKHPGRADPRVIAEQLAEEILREAPAKTAPLAAVG